MNEAVLTRALDGGLAMLTLVVLFMLVRSGLALIALFRNQGQQRTQDSQLADKLTTLVGELAATNNNVIGANTAATLRISEAMEKLALAMRDNTSEVRAMRDMLAVTGDKLDKYQAFVDDNIYGLADSVRRLGNQLLTFEGRMMAVLDTLEALQEMEARAATNYQVLARAIDADRLGRLRTLIAEERAHETDESGGDDAGAAVGADAAGAGAGRASGGGGGGDRAAGVAVGAAGAAGDSGPGGAAAGYQPGDDGAEGELPGGDG